jgi:small-conductance mechanosensitive channel
LTPTLLIVGYLYSAMVRTLLRELFAQNNIEIAFPQQDLHIDGAISVIGEASNLVRN